jgi:hypothetical protein
MGQIRPGVVVAPLLAVFVVATTQAATAQQCPPHSHARAVSIPGNLQAAHCWCDDGYQNIGGVCVRIEPRSGNAATPPNRQGRSN